jgi:hypothetical protein
MDRKMLVILLKILQPTLVIPLPIYDKKMALEGGEMEMMTTRTNNRARINHQEEEERRSWNDRRMFKNASGRSYSLGARRRGEEWQLVKKCQIICCRARAHERKRGSSIEWQEKIFHF